MQAAGRYFATAIGDAAERRLSAAGNLEVGTVIDSARSDVASDNVARLIGQHRIQIEPVTPEQARIARRAYRDFGRGSGHTDVTPA